MSKRTKIALVATGLLAVGAVAAISAPHHRMGGHRGGEGFGGMFHDGGMRFGGPVMGERMGERIKALDTNKDGVISIDEALARTDDTFTRMDRNKDGVVDKSDLDAIAAENAEYRALRILKQLDTDKDGKISKEEASKRAIDRFARFDVNGDGTINSEDMPAGWRDRMKERVERWREGRGEQKKAEAGAEKQDRADDDNRRGRGSREFDRASLTDRLDRNFSRVDANGDGFVDKAELIAMGSDRRARFEERFIKRFDTNKDGKVTKDEFEAPARARFAANDLNDDGKISDADLPPMLRGRGFLK